MSKIEKIESEIRTLSAEELSALRKWFLEYDAGVWDSKIQDDIGAGKLDSLAETALEAHRQGRTTEI
jgi:hypothetical protein